MSKIIARVIGIRPVTSSKDGSLFWNVGFKAEETISVATGIKADGTPQIETADTFSMASETEFPEDTLGKWFEIDGLTLRVAVDDDNQVVRHAGVGAPCINADKGRTVTFKALGAPEMKFI